MLKIKSRNELLKQLYRKDPEAYKRFIDARAKSQVFALVISAPIAIIFGLILIWVMK